MSTNRPKQMVAVAGLALAFAVVASCSDAFRDRASNDRDTRSQSVRVVPTFEIDGTHNFPENVRFDELGLSVASITLTPTDEDSDVAYTTSEPNRVRFDVDNGGLERRGESVDIPRRGKFDVTLRLEPERAAMQDSEGEEEEGVEPYSLTVSGHVAGTVASSESSIAGNRDVPPLPAPMEPDEMDDDSDEGAAPEDRSRRPSRWVEFEYRAEKSIALTLSEVELTDDREILEFRLDVEEWASELADPVERAVQSRRPSDANPDDGAVDVTRTVESRGEGTRTLDEHVSVRTVESRSQQGTSGGL